MKNKILNFKSALSVVALATMVTGCGKIDDFGDTNANPDAVTTPVTSALITSAESSLPGLVHGLRTVLYCQYVSETQYTDVSTYSLPQLESSGTYFGPLIDLQVVLNKSTNINEIAVAKILKSYFIWTITDRWGDVPYSEALLGQANLTPKYDKQEDIYKAIFKDLKEAVAALNIAGEVIKGDVIYNGDIAKWKKAGNTIRLMAALRLSKSNAALAQAEFADAATNAGGIITTNADNFKIVPPGGPQNSVFQNPWYATYFTRDDYGISKTMTDLLTGLGDNRISVFATNSVGFPYGLPRELAISFTNGVSNGHGRVLAASKRTETSPVVIIGASQALLAWAEGLERGWATNGTAKAAYEAGVAASFEEWGITMPAGYLTSTGANFASGSGVAAIGQSIAPWDAIPSTQNALTNTAIKRIQLQRYIAAFPNGNEGWAEWRRTGVPDLKPTRFATNSSKQIPRRYVYGVSEGSTNPAQLAVAVGRLTGGDTQDAKIWWDQ
ncbi:SusD/RagB family nutrient-binding outer membrane lipoprotein [Ferruginibacter sp.]